MVSHDELVAELRSLRKGAGLTMSKLKDCSTVSSVLSMTDLATIHKTLVDRLDDLPDDLKRASLVNAWAIKHHRPGTLTQRRNDFAFANDRHADTIENYENEAIEELANLLINVPALPALRPGNELLHEAAWQTGIEAIVRNGYLQDLILTNLFSADKQLKPRSYQGYAGGVSARNLRRVIYQAPLQPPSGLLLRFHFIEHKPSRLDYFAYQDAFKLSLGQSAWQRGAEVDDDGFVMFDITELSGGYIYLFNWD